MREFFAGFWEGLGAPFFWLFKLVAALFRWIFNIDVFPFRAIKRFNKFLNAEPDERPLLDVVTDLTSDPNTRQMMWEQLEAFRAHLLRSVAALAVAVCAAFFFTQPLMEYLAQPVGGLDKLTSIDMTESVGVFMTVALAAGISIAIPYIAFELWLFAAPGLRPHERKLGLAGIPFALFFFLSGAAFTFYVMLPAAIPFLLDFLGMKMDPRPQSYFSLVTGLIFWIGLFFEFPLVVYILTAIGLIEPKVLAEQWRLAVVVITIIAAAITPTVDPINQGLVMAPMILLYFISIGLSYIASAGRKRNLAREEAKAQQAE